MQASSVVLVSGSNSGFGRLMVETLARQGYSVFAGIRQSAGKNAAAAEELGELARRESLTLQVVELDVTDEASVERPLRSVVATAGQREGPQALNAGSEQVLAATREALGWAPFSTLQPAEV